MEFGFGKTAEFEIFRDCHPGFLPFFQSIVALSNHSFGRAARAGNQEKLWFDMGHSCPSDFQEILFLGVNGYGRGASKVLRG